MRAVHVSRLPEYKNYCIKVRLSIQMILLQIMYVFYCSFNMSLSFNTPYQRRSHVSGAWLSELAGKLLQSHESLDLDNNLTLHVQHVDIPRGNGRARVAVNMWTNILLKRCVITNVAQYNHIPCFGYALVLAINRLFTALTGVQYIKIE